MLDARHTAFPSSYDNSILITIWEEQKIVAVSLSNEGGLMTGEMRDIVVGGPHFRPVAFATDSEGKCVLLPIG